MSTLAPDGMHIWRLDVTSLLRAYYGISPRLDDGTQQTNLHPGDSVGVIFVPGAGTLAVTDSVTLTLRYDPEAVSLSSLVAGTGWRIADSSSANCSEAGASEYTCLTLTLHGDSAESVPDPLLHAEFQTYLTPSEGQTGSSAPRAFIYLDSAHSFFPQATPCAPTVLSLEQPDSVEIDFTGCGNQTILAAMEHQPPFRIASIVPNPAHTQITVRMVSAAPADRVVSAAPGGLTCQLFDQLGTCVLATQGAGTAPLRLDVRSLPSGIYFLRISSGGYALSRSVSIER